MPRSTGAEEVLNASHMYSVDSDTDDVAPKWSSGNINKGDSLAYIIQVPGMNVSMPFLGEILRPSGFTWRIDAWYPFCFFNKVRRKYGTISRLGTGTKSRRWLIFM